MESVFKVITDGGTKDIIPTFNNNCKSFTKLFSLWATPKNWHYWRKEVCAFAIKKNPLHWNIHHGLTISTVYETKQHQTADSRVCTLYSWNVPKFANLIPRLGHTRVVIITSYIHNDASNNLLINNMIITWK